MPEVAPISPETIAAVVEALRPLIPAPLAFNPNSLDSQFSNLHTSIALQDKSRNYRMDRQDEVLKEIVVQTTKTNARVTKLEGRWKNAFAWLAGASASISAGLYFLVHFWK